MIELNLGTMLDGVDLNWHHYIPQGYEDAGDMIEDIGSVMYDDLEFASKKAQGVWDVVKESTDTMTLY